jgi:ABC-type Fe3+ transport system permease subunit
MTYAEIVTLELAAFAALLVGFNIFLIGYIVRRRKENGK